MQSEIYSHNHKTILSVVSQAGAPSKNPEEALLTLSLERILVDRDLNKPVAFDGEDGIEAVLEAVARLWSPFAQIRQEDHLVGLRGDLILANGNRVTLTITLGAGGQVICTTGPSTSVEDMLAVVEAFDRKVHVAAQELGHDYGLLAEGYNPFVSSPLDVPLVPRTRWTLLNAHLAQTGRYARDAMRCGCATVVRVNHSGGRGALASYKLATALSPILTFLTDNVSTFRGTGARRNPRMVRSIMWDEVDTSRCGVVPGTLSPNFSFDSYVDWLEGIQPILFTADDGTTSSTGKDTLRELMESREISEREAARLLRTVFPNVRLCKGYVELLQADALRPHVAAGYLAFVKGLVGSELSVDSCSSLLGSLANQDVIDAATNLRKQGWDATVYDKNAGTLVDQLLRIARSSLSDEGELRLLNNLAELWEVRMVPRDSFVHQETKQIRGW